MSLWNRVDGQMKDNAGVTTMDIEGVERVIARLVISYIVPSEMPAGRVKNRGLVSF